jgi:hypothetical protein
MKRSQQPEVFRPKSGIDLMQAISENRPCEMPEVFARKAVTYLLARVDGDFSLLPSETEGCSLLVPSKKMSESCRRWLRNQKP